MRETGIDKIAIVKMMPTNFVARVNTWMRYQSTYVASLGMAIDALRLRRGKCPHI
jgi:hypothetical protein